MIANKKEVKEGIDLALSVVSPTLGVEGRTAIVPNVLGIGGYATTDDGLTAVKAIEETGAKEVGVAFVRQIAVGMEGLVGDGRTTGMVMFKAFVDQLEDIPYRISLRDEIKQLGGEISTALTQLATPVAKGDLAKIAANSSLDPEAGKLIAEALTELGVDTDLFVDVQDDPGVRLEMVKGLEFKQGMASPYMVNNSKGSCVIENPLILVTDQTISRWEQLSLITRMEKAGLKKLVIICREIVDEALMAASQVASKSPFELLVVSAEGSYELLDELLEDIAIMTGAEVLTEASGVGWDMISPKHLGTCKRVVSDRERTAIIGGGGKPEALKLHVDTLKEQMKRKAKKPQQEMRISRLTGGLATIFLGSPSRAELEVKKHKVEDAVSATRAAMRSGVMSGGGAELVKLELPDTQAGKIIRKALQAPLIQMAENVGLDPMDIMQDVKSAPFNWGYDFREHRVRDLVKAGIVDPLNVVKGAFETALATALTYWTVSSVILPNPTEDDQGNK